MSTASPKMTVEIWSDVMCPFCYIGKRKFEAALEQFPDKDRIQVIWKSFQLSPDMQTDPSKSINQFLAEHKGIELEDAKRLNERVTGMAQQVGLTYNFDRSVVANSFNAHRFTHFAKAYGKQSEAEEQLFNAYFTDGKNIDDFPTLIQLGKEIGLDPEALQRALGSGAYAQEVIQDIYEAQQVGARGVPFFLFDGQYAIPGALESWVFGKVLEQSFAAWKRSNPDTFVDIAEGESCTPGEDCQ